jgi:hypothetical protein
MARLHIITEGPTEKNFVDEILCPYLAEFHVFTDAHNITTRRDRSREDWIHRGGLTYLKHLYTDIKNWLVEANKQDDCWVTTLVDLYAFPYKNEKDWMSGYERCTNGAQQADYLEAQLLEKFGGYPDRFIPYLQLHEIEALLLVSPEKIHEGISLMAGGISHQALKRLRDDIGTSAPEDINQGPTSAPSKRIIRHYPPYNDSKPTYFSIIAGQITITPMLETCPRFARWVAKLAKLGNKAPTA